MMTTTDDSFLRDLPNDLQSKVKKVIKMHPETASIFQELIENMSTGGGPVHKKSKISSQEEIKDVGDLKVKFSELSFQLPLRKKANLQLHDEGLSLLVGGSVEFSLLYSEIDRILCLPSPNKGKAHYTWVLIPKDDGEDCILPANTALFAFDDNIPKFNIDTKLELDDSAFAAGVNDLMKAAFDATCTTAEICCPDPDVFSSSDTTGYNQKAVSYINCYDRAKEGYMYFFEFGLFFGFKKPLMFYPIEDIDRLEITSITGRFFNLHIILNGMEKGDFQEYSMFAAAELKGVNEYISKHFKATPTDKTKGKGVEKHVSLIPKGATSIANAQLDSDEDDEDFALEPNSEGGIAEEYDTGHETDSGSSSVDVVNSDSDEGEEEGEEDLSESNEDVVVFEARMSDSEEEEEKAPKQSNAQIQAMEKQHNQRSQGAPKTVVALPADDEEEELGDSSDEDSREMEEDDYETGSEVEVEDDAVEEVSAAVQEISGQTEEDELA